MSITEIPRRPSLKKASRDPAFAYEKTNTAMLTPLPTKAYLRPEARPEAPIMIPRD